MARERRREGEERNVDKEDEDEEEGRKKEEETFQRSEMLGCHLAMTQSHIVQPLWLLATRLSPVRRSGSPSGGSLRYNSEFSYVRHSEMNHGPNWNRFITFVLVLISNDDASCHVRSCAMTRVPVCRRSLTHSNPEPPARSSETPIGTAAQAGSPP